MSKLHPENNKLWQRPRSSFFSTENTWYCNEPVGEKKLTVFMSELIKSAALSDLHKPFNSRNHFIKEYVWASPDNGSYCVTMCEKSIPLKMNLSCLGAHDNVKWAVLGH
jgi:hypothetical protein